MADAGRLIVAAASRPYPGERLNGDAWAVEQAADAWWVGVVDGLGHGPAAAEASERAIETLRAHPGLEPDALIDRCHRALIGTRGAAMLAARLTGLTGSQPRLSYAGIGNVEGRLYQSGRVERLMVYRGIVGGPPRTPRRFGLDLEPGWLLALHSDGISVRFELSGQPIDGQRDLQAIADGILERWGRATDDATIVLVQDGTSAGDVRERGNSGRP